jgi:hypothetical protein
LKKLILYILFPFYLLSATSLQELVKLPVLFQHFFEHKEINQQITFANFLIDHYNDIPHTDNDEERDNQLPFKSLDTSTTANTIAIHNFQELSLNLATIPLPMDKMTTRDDHFAGNYHYSIWQPPKV